ncbi:MAG TPA: DUF4331 family protein [Planctomycetota bacterium]|nr:DUF4331 family protein [Planctomycetota bacterium]
MRRGLTATALIALLAGAAALWSVASDHDDGETATKGRSVNLTDVYAFREGDQSGNPADNDKLILVMNTNPRSLARQQYYFATNARYEFHLTRRAGPDAPVTATDDVILRVEFGAPDASNQQSMTLTAIRDGAPLAATTVVGGGPILTTPVGQPDPAEFNNSILLDGASLTAFAGMREDPFFFDVEQFFRVRAFALGLGPDPRPTPGSGPLFRDAATAVDFTSGYNVNSIVLRVPISFLAGATGSTTFDVWTTISVRS